MRLIDADELLKKAAHWKEICTSDLLIRMIEAFEKGISEVQTVSAIPVVRCRDCINRGKDDCPMHIKETEPDEELLLSVDNDYCSYGKRGDKNAAD